MTSPKGQPLPRIEGESLEEIADALQEALNIIDARLTSLEQVVREEPYLPSNFTNKRSLDAGSATTNDVADHLATLTQDLIDRGYLNGTRRFD